MNKYFELQIICYQYNPDQTAYRKWIHSDLFSIAQKAANTLRRSDPEEFISHALIHFFEKINEIDFCTVKNLRGFLYRLMLNKMRDLLRMNQRRMNRFPYWDEITTQENENELSRETSLLSYA